MTSGSIVITGTAKSSSAHTPSSTSGTSATLTSAGEPEWSKEEDEMCWFMIRTLEHFAPNGQWPSAGVWRARYSLSNVATPPQGRTESELRRRCITLVDQRHAQRLAQAQAKGDGSLSAVAQQPKSPAPQLNVTLPKKSQAPDHAKDAGKDTSKGEIGSEEEESTSKEQSDAEAEEETAASSSKEFAPSKPMRLRKSIVKKMKAARRGRKQASMLLKGNFDSFKVKKVGRRSKIITFKGKGTIRVPL